MPSAAAETMSAVEARRIALAAQGFTRRRPAGPVTRKHLAGVVDRLGLFQIDSVNVLVRAHYLPAFARIGAYDRTLLDQLAWGRPRALFEYWAHEASLLPLEYHPLLRWRMARADRGEGTWAQMKPYATVRRAEADALLARIEAEGPLAASDVAESRGQKGWWNWSDAKHAFEFLFWAGHITTRTRRGSFERVYDLPSRVFPETAALPTPPEDEAHRALVDHSARALGVATQADIRDYFRLRPADCAKAIAALVEDGRLQPVTVAGWRSAAYRHVEARGGKATGAALLAPFDPLVFARDRAERLFGVRYRIEIYTPAEKRLHGYYVLPFLLDGKIVARVDLKSDRKGGRLVVQNAHAEPGAPDDMPERLAAELAAMAAWLGLAEVAAGGRGGLAETLATLHVAASPTAPLIGAGH